MSPDVGRNRFIYDPSAKKRYDVKKQKWIEGRHFWESGIKIMEKMIPGLLEAKGSAMDG